MAGREPFTGPSSRRKTLSSRRQDPLGLSPEDDLRPPANKTLSISPCEGENLFPEVGETRGPCVSPLPRGEQEGSSSSQERPCSRRLRTTRAPASLPSQGRTRGVLRRRESAIPPSVDRSSRGGRTSFPGRPPLLQAILQESKNPGTPKQTRADDPRPRRGRRRCLRECRWVRRFPSLFGQSKKGGSPRRGPEGRLDGMRLRAPRVALG